LEKCVGATGLFGSTLGSTVVDSKNDEIKMTREDKRRKAFLSTTSRRSNSNSNKKATEQQHPCFVMARLIFEMLHCASMQFGNTMATLAIPAA
jgi:NAD dependent epimerase/dehydratase family enzyme